MQLGPNIWFVRSNGGSGSYPVTPEGWRVVYDQLIQQRPPPAPG